MDDQPEALPEALAEGAVPTAMVQMPLSGEPLAWSMQRANAEGGVLVFFTSPMNVKGVLFDRDGSLKFADALRENAGALQIATAAVPPPSANGHGPLGGV